MLLASSFVGRLLSVGAASWEGGSAPARCFSVQAAKTAKESLSKDAKEAKPVTRRRTSKTATTAPKEAAEEPPHTLAAESVLRLHSDAQWQSVKTWVVFSDLHVNDKTVKYCCEVLDRVKFEAAARNAGIIFLGDFWHQRGALPVPPLNAVLQRFQDWPYPTLMLVGNHDQVDIGGSQHGITPLAAAASSVHIIDSPTKLLNALWLPYRRDHRELQAAMDAARQHGPVAAIFAHADVVGASVNETYQAREGMMPDAFPQAIPIYTGHYHKPHTVPNTEIHYIGSPYQVSRSEATQQKRFLVLDSATWQVQETIHLDIGPRHFSIQDHGDAAEAPPHVPEDVRSGDSVRWTVPTLEQQPEVEQAMQELRSKGVEVEVVVKPPEAVSRIEHAETLGALELLHEYARNTDMPPDALAGATSILQDIGQQGSTLQPSAVDLQLQQLTLSGYGPFRDEVTYKLGDRGLRVVTGKNKDDTAADSNGAGKSALVMAPLWAITGRTEPRSESGTNKGLLAGDIVNDDAKAAKVKVLGCVNGTPFTVERTGKRKGAGTLTFQLGGVDLTQHDKVRTQQHIDTHLAAQLMPKAVFHTQTDIAGLLEANDKGFKEELGQLVELEVWESAKDRAAEQLRATKDSLAAVSSRAATLAESEADLHRKVEVSRANEGMWEQQRAGSHQRLVDAEAAATAKLQRELHLLQQCQAMLQSSLQESHSIANAVAQEAVDEPDTTPSDGTLMGAGAEDASRLAELRRELAELQQEVQRFNGALMQDQGRRGAASQDLRIKQQTLQEYSRLSASSAHEAEHSFNDHASGTALGVEVAAPVCDRCLQPIDSHRFAANVTRMQEAVSTAQESWQASDAAIATQQAQLTGAQQQRQAAEVRLRAAEDAHRAALDRRKKAEQQRLFARQQLESRQEHARMQVKRIQDVSSRCQQTLDRYLPRIAQARQLTPQQLGTLAEFDASDAQYVGLDHQETVQHAGTELDRAQQSLMASARLSNPHSSQVTQLQALLQDAAAKLQDAQQRQQGLEHSLRWQSIVDKAFGRGGIQSFALEGILQELQARCAGYLEQLSSGHALLLRASRPAKDASVAEIEKISKTVTVCTGTASGKQTVRERSVKQLSGGERRRIALALALAYGDLAATRGRLKCNLLVLDEVLQQLDGEGCARVCALLKQMPQASVLVVAQAKSFATQEFDAMDLVVKENACSYVAEA